MSSYTKFNHKPVEPLLYSIFQIYDLSNGFNAEVAYKGYQDTKLAIQHHIEEESDKQLISQSIEIAIKLLADEKLETIYRVFGREALKEMNAIEPDWEVLEAFEKYMNENGKPEYQEPEMIRTEVEILEKVTRKGETKLRIKFPNQEGSDWIPIMELNNFPKAKEHYLTSLRANHPRIYNDIKRKYPELFK